MLTIFWTLKWQQSHPEWLHTASQLSLPLFTCGESTDAALQSTECRPAGQKDNASHTHTHTESLSLSQLWALTPDGRLVFCPPEGSNSSALQNSDVQVGLCVCVCVWWLSALGLDCYLILSNFSVFAAICDVFNNIDYRTAVMCLGLLFWRSCHGGRRSLCSYSTRWKGYYMSIDMMLACMQRSCKQTWRTTFGRGMAVHQIWQVLGLK